MRKIALISEHASPLAALGGADSGGQNVYVAQLARNLALLGWQVDVLTRRDAPDLPDVAELCAGVRVIHVSAGPAAPLPKEELLPHMGAFSDVTRAICEHEGYDLLHANFWMSALVAARVKCALRLPFVVTFHALGRVRRQHQGESDRFPDARFEIEERVAREADLVIAECPQDRDDLIALYGVDPSRIRIAPCGVDPVAFAAVPRRLARDVLSLPQDAFIALQLGRMVPRKGVDTAIEGFARFRARADGETRLVVVGGEADTPDPGTTPELGRLHRLADAAGVGAETTFTGRRPSDVLRYYYSAADAFLTLPWYEPFGITPLEAMACAVPVIGADVGGIKYSVQHGVTGLLVPPRDPGAVADALLRLHGAEDERARMGSAGRARVLEKFTWQQVARQVEGIYDEALAKAATVSPMPVPAMQIRQAFDELRSVLSVAQDRLGPAIVRAAKEVETCFARGGKLLIAGNGGSAAEAQHLAAEFVGRFQIEGRRALPAIALCADSATLTSWSNDYGFDDVFARQVEAFGKPGDLLLAFSTSGRSANLVRAFEAAHAQGLRCIALLGKDGGALVGRADVAIVVPSDSVARIQEVHTFLLHQICEHAELALARQPSPAGIPIIAAQSVDGLSAAKLVPAERGRLP